MTPFSQSIMGPVHPDGHPLANRVRRRVFHSSLAILLLGILFAQTITAIPQLSITWDEDLHIVSGYSILRTGDWRLIEEHPPLIKFWMSWPLLLSPQMPDLRDTPAWDQNNLLGVARSQAWNRLPYDSRVIPSRITIAWLAMILGACLFRWASEWFGSRAGLVALALMIFDPNILAHSTLATIDLGATCFIFIAMYALQRLVRQYNRLNLMLAGAVLGLALATKVSALILLPIYCGLMLLKAFERRTRAWVIRLLICLGVAGVMFWAVYLFQIGTPQGFGFPLPASAYWQSFERVAQHSLGDNSAYLMGQFHTGWRWYYFPIVFAIKTPLPALIFLAMTLLVIRRTWLGWWRELILAGLPVCYLAASLVSTLNIGYRHLLPIVPFVYLTIVRFISYMFSRITSRRRSILSRLPVVGAMGLLLWQVIGTWQIRPFYLTFFSEVVGGPRNGYRYLSDSNVDWGQGLKALRLYLETHNVPDARVSIVTPFINPKRYGIQNIEELPPSPRVPGLMAARYNPPPGTYIISAFALRGFPLLDPDTFNWFWNREPDDLIANAMLVYKVRAQAPSPTWLAECAAPDTLLPPEQAAEGFGRTDLRIVYFDCSTSWVYPAGGKSPGWVALAPGASIGTDQWLKTAHLSYEQTRPGYTPPIRIYQVDAPVAFSFQGSARVAPPAMALADLSGLPPLDLPVKLEGGLTLLGYTVSRSTLKPGETFYLETLWRVDSVPDRMLSIMAHALGPNGQAIAIGDGLGVPVESWRQSDVFIQRHTLALPQNAPTGTYWVQTGVYWLDNGERWSIHDARAAGDRLMLVPVKVK